MIVLLSWFSSSVGQAQIGVKGETVHTLAGPAISNGVVLIRDGKIERVGAASQIAIPKGYRILQAKLVIPGLISQPQLRVVAVFGVPLILCYVLGKKFDQFAFALGAVLWASSCYTVVSGRTLHRERNFPCTGDANDQLYALEASFDYDRRYSVAEWTGDQFIEAVFATLPPSPGRGQSPTSAPNRGNGGRRGNSAP
jgi:hypothetical protein